MNGYAECIHCLFLSLLNILCIAIRRSPSISHRHQSMLLLSVMEKVMLCFLLS